MDQPVLEHDTIAAIEMQAAGEGAAIGHLALPLAEPQVHAGTGCPDHVLAVAWMNGTILIAVEDDRRHHASTAVGRQRRRAAFAHCSKS